jgi:hypothetical protein
VCLKTDCLAAVAKPRSVEMDRSPHRPLVEEVKDLLKGFAESTVKHVRRSGNRIAHVLAKEGSLNNCNRTSVEAPPNLVVELLASECAVE